MKRQFFLKKKIFILFALLFGNVCFCAGAARDRTDNEIVSVRGLVHRLIPEQEKNFVFRLLPNTEKDQFRIESNAGKIIIEGNNANSMAVGLNHYLKYYCHVEVGWYTTDTFKMPAKLPAVESPITVNARCKNRFFLNYCTFGYTMPWWKWKEWEHFIDWMALNGINLPLAITGQESIWYKVWKDLGLTDRDIRNYFTGPAYLPWHRMLNIDYWQGPLPHSWLEGQQELQKKIVAREREFNMRPVLPAFAGHVPSDLKKIYPNAKITRLGAWSGFPDEYACSFLDPMDPLFTKIQKRFLDTETEIYGTNHIYGIDLFNELTPPSWDPEYLGRVSRQVYESLSNADPQAIWLQMTWLFYNERKDWTNDRVKPYITAFPSDHSLLLDYYCERQEVWQRTDKFFGTPYIWCYLGNFGGNTMLVGNIAEINKRLENTFINGGYNFTGVGSTLEGFDCNPFIYEYVFEKAWDFKIHKNLDQWVKALADQRVGKKDANGRKAWKLLIDSIYITPSVPGQCPLINIRPTFGKYRTYYANPRIKYDNKNLLKATELLLAANGKNEAYSFDVTNLTRQLLSNYFLQVFRDYENAYKNRNRSTMNTREKEMIEIMEDVDRLLASQPAFLVGKWIADARSWGKTADEADYFERDARNIITTWGDKDMLLNDYASRTWAGLTETFYEKRWKMFFSAVESALNKGEAFDDEHYEAYKKQVTSFEKDWWVKRTGKFNSKPSGDSKKIAKDLVKKYKRRISCRIEVR
ncbi:MAG: alpha-N-acetylglucosaminidase [Bacteroidales bacterium]|jgi:alpha-N-acetylglucosaminidase|nr:alpha-N-acetylglucosaminidase [Bacteroidales bacterium]